MIWLRTLATTSALILALSTHAWAIHPHPPKNSVLKYTGPNAPPYYGFPVPSTTWGWFGVRYWPTQSCHYGYYGNYKEWGYRQGY